MLELHLTRSISVVLVRKCELIWVRFMNIYAMVYGLAVAALVVCLIVLLWKRQLHREFPFFFIYLISVVLATLAEDAVSQNPYSYFDVYWSCEGIHAVLVLLALYEAFRKVFLVFYKAWPGFEVILPVTAVIIVLLAGWNAASHPAIQADPVIVVILAVGKVVRYLQVGIFALFFLLVWILGLDWEEYPFGIVLGFTISAVGAWLGYDVRSEYGLRFITFAKYVGPGAYLVAILVWLAAFRRPQTEPKQWLLGITAEQMLIQAKQYLAVLKGK